MKYKKQENMHTSKQKFIFYFSFFRIQIEGVNGRTLQFSTP